MQKINAFSGPSCCVFKAWQCPCNVFHVSIRAGQAGMGILMETWTVHHMRRQMTSPRCAGESKNVLLSPTVSRRLSGIAPELAASSENMPSPRRSSVSRSGGRGSAAGASAVTSHNATQPKETAALPPQPGNSFPPEDSAAAMGPDSLAEAPAAVDNPAPPAKRRRRNSGVTSTVAVPVPHHHRGQAGAAVGSVDKPFSDKAAKVERLQWVQCDRCGKWRLLEPHYQASFCPAGFADDSERILGLTSGAMHSAICRSHPSITAVSPSSAWPPVSLLTVSITPEDM